MRSLSRLKSLQAFEAAARHGSFVGAAAELHVTAAAVGQLVRSLEISLGSPLFLRRKSGRDRLVPVDDARAALADVAAGLDSLEMGLRRLRERQDRAVVAVTASQALVARWLLPRLDDFSARHPGIDVRLDVTDRVVDVGRAEADIGLRFGPGHWSGVRTTLLAREEIFPVCSPSLLSNGRLPTEPSWLLARTLIHEATLQGGDYVPSWTDWLARAGLTGLASGPGIRINAPGAVIQAAVQGTGVALVRRALVIDDVAAGRLIRLFPELPWRVAWAYYAVTSVRSRRRPAVVVFHDWLVERWSADAG